MNIEHLRTFLEVAAAGSFHRAAETLHVTQSTVSARIKALETSLDQPLFVRAKNGAELTAAGRRLQRPADVAVRAWEQGRQAVALPGALRAVVGFGVQTSLWDRLVPAWLARMRASAPDVGLLVEADYSESLMRLMGDGLLEMAVIFAPRTRPGITIEPFLNDRVILVSTDPRAVDGGWRDDYVFVDWSYDFSIAHSQAFPDMERPAISVGLPAIARDYILANGGAAYLSESMAAPLIESGRLHRVDDAPVFSRPAFLVTRNAPSDPGVQAMAVASLKQVAAVPAQPAAAARGS